MEFLKQDLDNLFNDKGVDKSQYDDKVNFMDPITKYGSVTGTFPVFPTSIGRALAALCWTDVQVYFSQR